MSPTALYLLRAAVVTALAVVGALTTALVDNSITNLEIVVVVGAGLGAFGGYLGVGAASKTLEPDVGHKK